MEFKKERNEEFIRRVELLLRNPPAGVPLSLQAAARTVAAAGAPRFYLTREYAWKQLRLRRRRSSPPPAERPYVTAMWAELARALNERMRSHPSEEEWVALDYVLLRVPASRFFISEAEALRLAGKAARPALKPAPAEWPLSPGADSPARLRLPLKRRHRPIRRSTPRKPGLSIIPLKKNTLSQTDL